MLDRKGTLAERARLIDEEEESLADLGLLPRFEEDLRKRLPEQLRALSGGGRRPSAADLGRSLSLSRAAVDRLALRFSLALRPAPPERRIGARGGARADGGPARCEPAADRAADRPPPPGAAPPPRALPAAIVSAHPL